MALVVKGTTISKVVGNGIVLGKVNAKGVTVYTSTKNLGWDFGIWYHNTDGVHWERSQQTGAVDLTDYRTMTFTWNGLNFRASEYSYATAYVQLKNASTGAVVGTWYGQSNAEYEYNITFDISGLSGNYYMYMFCNSRGSGNYAIGNVKDVIVTA